MELKPPEPSLEGPIPPTLMIDCNAITLTDCRGKDCRNQVRVATPKETDDNALAQRLLLKDNHRI